MYLRNPFPRGLHSDKKDTHCRGRSSGFPGPTGLPIFHKRSLWVDSGLNHGRTLIPYAYEIGITAAGPLRIFTGIPWHHAIESAKISSRRPWGNGRLSAHFHERIWNPCAPWYKQSPSRANAYPTVTLISVSFSSSRTILFWSSA